MDKKLLKKTIILCVAIFAIQLNAQNATFNNGGGDNLWSNTANWNTGVLPTGVATITTDVILDGDYTIDQLITPSNLETNITVSTSSNNTLTMSGVVAFFLNNRLNGVLTIECNIITTAAGKTIAAQNFASNKLVFGAGSTLTIDGNTTLRNNSAIPMEFNGNLAGSANVIIATTASGGSILFGSTADNSAFTGQFIDFQEDIISNIAGGGLFASDASDGIQFNNISGSITFNGEDSMEGSISRTNTNAGTSVVNFNANQSNMGLLAISASNAAAILDLNIDSSVTNLVFNSLVLNTGTNDGVLNIVGFKDDVIKFGVTLTQDQLDAIKIDGITTPGLLTQTANGYLVTTTLNTESNVLDNTSVYPNPVRSILYVNSLENSEVELFNILGTKVKSITNNTGNLQLDIADLPTGLYMLKISLNNKTSTTKVVIN